MSYHIDVVQEYWRDYFENWHNIISRLCWKMLRIIGTPGNVVLRAYTTRRQHRSPVVMAMKFVKINARRYPCDAEK